MVERLCFFLVRSRDCRVVKYEMFIGGRMGVWIIKLGGSRFKGGSCYFILVYCC